MPFTMHQQSAPHQSKPQRLKILLLGSSGAGKTSLLRRFVNGTFHSPTIAEANNSRQRNTMSTLGADYFVKRMKNPLYRKEIKVQECSSCRAVLPNKCSRQRKSKMYKEPHVLVQLWDTRGTEPSLPRYNRKRTQFSMYQFLSLDYKKDGATIKSCNGIHLHRYNNWGVDKPSKLEGCVDFNIPKRQLSNIIHDKVLRNSTEGSLRRRNGTPNALFDNIDACVLVYDATSSTSFLRLMTCHEEWIKQFNDQEQSMSKSKRRRRVSFIVVANKIDLLDGHDHISNSKISHRRAVLGLKTYKGVDEKYEYAAEKTAISERCDCCCLKCRDSQHSQKQQKNIERNNKLTYSLKETGWSSDLQYLSYLQQADDQLGANRTMVLLWCKRNGIRHVEASALDGRGVDTAMEELVRLCVEERVNRDYFDSDPGHNMEDHGISDVDFDIIYAKHKSDEEDDQVQRTRINVEHESTDQKYVPTQQTFLYQPTYDKKLDLFARYATNKEDNKCRIMCLKC